MDWAINYQNKGRNMAEIINVLDRYDISVNINPSSGLAHDAAKMSPLSTIVTILLGHVYDAVVVEELHAADHIWLTSVHKIYSAGLGWCISRQQYTKYTPMYVTT